MKDDVRDVEEEQRELLLSLIDAEKLNRVSDRLLRMCSEEKLNYVEMVTLMKATLETMSENGPLWDRLTDNLDRCGPVLEKVALMNPDTPFMIVDVIDKKKPNMGL